MVRLVVFPCWFDSSCATKNPHTFFNFYQLIGLYWRCTALFFNLLITCTMKMLIKNEDDYTIIIKDNKHHQLMEKARKDEEPYHGKYLLFATNRDILMKAAKEIIDHFNLSEYWISRKDQNNGMFSFVCKIYDTDDNLSHNIDTFIHMSIYRNEIAYRFFKPEWKSKQGFYSEAYLKAKKEGPNAL